MHKEYQGKLENFYGQNKRMPTYSEMTKLFGFRSKNAVFKIVEKLVEAGMVAKDHLGRLVPTEAFGEIQMAGYVKAGPPSDVDELYDTVDLDDLLIGKKEITYMVKVDGDSMIEAHIEEEDYVIVEKINIDQARDGDIVIAKVDDDQFTMKYFKKDKGKVWLEPANKKYKAIYPEYNLEITGKVKAVIRKY